MEVTVTGESIIVHSYSSGSHGETGVVEVTSVLQGKEVTW